MSSNIQPKFHIGDYIRWTDLSKMEKFHGEIYDIQYFDSEEAFVYYVQTPDGPIPVLASFQDEWEKVLFYIENSVDECHSKIKGYFNTLNEAMEAIKECSDWYRENGTGEIWMTGFGLKSHKQQVYCK